MNSGRTIFPLWMIAVCVNCILLTLLSTTLLHSQTWEGLNGPPKARDIRDISISNDGSTIYACDKSVLFKSVNGGTSWTATGSLPENEVRSPLAVACKPSTQNTAVVGLSNYLKRTSDGGSTFDQVRYEAGMEPLRLSVSPVNQDQMYMGRKSLGSNSSILRSMNGGLDWSSPMTFPSGTNINDIAAWPTSSQKVFAAGSNPSGAVEGSPITTRGVWKYTDLGVNWTLKGGREYNLKSIAITGSGSLIFAGSGVSGRIFYSVDEGQNWTKTSTDIGGGADSIRALRIRNGSELWAATDAGLFKSTNSGTNWTNKSPGENNILSFVIAPGNQNTLYATTYTSVWKSTNGGDNWDNVSNNLGRMPLSSVTASSNATTSSIWTASNIYDTAGNYDGYTTWTTPEITGFYAEHIVRAPGDLVYLAGSKSSNKGALYLYGTPTPLYETSQAAGNMFLGSMVDPQDATRIYLWGKDGSTNFYRILNYGAGTKDAFTVGGSTYTVNDVAVYSSSGPYYYGLNNNGGVWKCASGPCTGTQTGLTNMTVKSLALRTGDPNVVYAAGTGGLKHTMDGGTMWYLRYGYDLKRVVMSPGYSTSKNILILRADGEKILYSSTSGSSYTEVQGNLPKPIRDIRGITGTPPVIYAATDQGVYRFYGLQTAPTLASPADQATVGAVPTLTWSDVSGATEYHLIIATDQGFSNVVLDLFLAATSATPATLTTPGTYYWKVAATNFVGEVYSGSRSFTTQAQGTISLSATTFFGTDSKWHPRLSWTHSGQGSNPVFYIYRYICTYGSPDCGVWPYPLLAMTTGTLYEDYSAEVAVKGQTPEVTFYYQVRSAGISNKVTRNGFDGETKQAIVEDRLPRETRLYHNYPNPFNPKTTIKYDLSVSGRVTLKVYDVLGEEVATLVDEIQEGGYKSVEFDASRLPSGVYFYRFSAGMYQYVQKMILIK